MAKLLKTDGTEIEIVPKDGKSFKLQELYAAIGCQMVQICDAKNRGEILIFDEEFFCRGDIVKHPSYGYAIEGSKAGEYKPWLNRKATDAMHSKMEPYRSNVVCGTAILCKGSQFK